jgi:hypothetical protein
LITIILNFIKPNKKTFLALSILIASDPVFGLPGMVPGKLIMLLALLSITIDLFLILFKTKKTENKETENEETENKKTENKTQILYEGWLRRAYASYYEFSNERRLRRSCSIAYCIKSFLYTQKIVLF